MALMAARTAVLFDSVIDPLAEILSHFRWLARA